MRDFDGASFGREIVSSVKEYVAPVVSRLDAMEKSHEDRGRRAIDAETAVGKKIEELEAQVKEAADSIPGHVAKALAERPASVEVSQIVEALGAFDLNAFFKDAVMLGAAGGGIDIVAPDDVSVEMTAAISMLSTAAPVTKAIERVPEASPMRRARTFRFDRDERGMITAAHEE